jgi:hypothetical protein
MARRMRFLFLFFADATGVLVVANLFLFGPRNDVLFIYSFHIQHT